MAIKYPDKLTIHVQKNTKKAIKEDKHKTTQKEKENAFITSFYRGYDKTKGKST